MSWLGAESFDCFEVELTDGVLITTFNQPEALNAFTLEAMNELALILHAAKVNPAIKVFLLTGKGKAFSSGGNVKGMGSKKEGQGNTHFLERPMWNVPSMSVEERLKQRKQTGRELMLAVHHLDKPTIAAVNGLAAGAGMDISLACDIRYAAEEARFSQIYIRRGIAPVDGGMYWLPRIVGLSKAFEMLYTGDWVGAQEALSIGLVSKVYPQEQLLPAALELAKRLAKAPPMAIQTIKHGVRKCMQATMEQALEYSYATADYLFASEDHKEGIAAFMEKRDPVFRGR